MFTPIFRLFILLFLAISSVIMAMRGEFLMLILASFISLFLLWDYTYRGTIPLAMSKLFKNDPLGAEKYLEFINRPNILNKNSQFKYYLIKGMAHHHRDEFQEAIDNLELSLAIPIKKNSLRAMSLITLTDIFIIKGHNNKARDYFKQLEGMRIDKALVPTVEKLKIFFEEKRSIKTPYKN